MKKKYIKKYCVGCGLCNMKKMATFETDEKGFSYPKVDEALNNDFLQFCDE